MPESVESIIEGCAAGQEAWLHAKTHGWDSPQMFEHIFRLTNIQISTKQHVEDVLGTVSDAVTRDQKKFANMSPERLFFTYSRSKRLEHTGVAFVDPCQHGDLHSVAARNFQRPRRQVFGLAQTVTQEVPKLMKELCKAGNMAIDSSQLWPGALLTTLVSQSRHAPISLDLLPDLFRESPHLAPGKSDLPRQVRMREWKAAGQPADFAAAAGMLALRRTSPSNFLNFGGLWTVCLLQEGSLFCDTAAGVYILSLGAVRQAALGRVVEEIEARQF